jgi:hypothetical protein
LGEKNVKRGTIKGENLKKKGKKEERRGNKCKRGKIKA